MYPTLYNGLASILAAPAPVSDASVEGSVSGIIFYISIALGFSFLCSVLEAVLLSTSLSQIELAVADGKRYGTLMQKHKQNVETPISAILTLNTIAHTVGAAGAGAQATAVFGNEWFGVISAVLTLMILVFSEIIPKTIGAVYWKQLMPFAAYTTQLLVVILYPIVWLLQQTTRLFQSDEDHPTVTRSELEVMAKISAVEGALDENENKVLRNLFQLNRVHVDDIMTPRTVMFALPQNTTIGEVVEKHPHLPYSRIPIFGENHDDIKFFVLRHDIFSQSANDKNNIPLIELKRPIHSVPATLSVAKVLNEFTTRGEHIFLVFDEYGGTAGIITMEDAVESLLGAEITDESDIVADMREFAQQRYKRQLGLLGGKIVTGTTPGVNRSSSGENMGERAEDA